MTEDEFRRTEPAVYQRLQSRYLTQAEMTRERLHPLPYRSTPLAAPRALPLSDVSHPTRQRVSWHGLTVCSAGPHMEGQQRPCQQGCSPVAGRDPRLGAARSGRTGSPRSRRELAAASYF